MWASRRAATLLTWFFFPMAAFADKQYLLILSPATRKVYYSETPSFHDWSLPRDKRPEEEAKILIDGEADKCQGSDCDDTSNQGLNQPQGLALHQADGTSTLYVSDCQEDAIYAYNLKLAWDGSSVEAEGQRQIRRGIEGGVSWLAMDGVGNLFYTTRETAQIRMIAASVLADDKLDPEGGSADPVLHTATVPLAGLVADNYYLYMANLDSSDLTGTIARVAEDSASGKVAQVKSVTATGYGAFGVCVARDNVFFAAEERRLFAADARGGSPVEVSHGFHKPRGCAYDEEGSLYVADRGLNAIYALPANFVIPRAVRTKSKVTTVTEPTQIVVLSANAGLKVPALRKGAAGRPSAGSAILMTLVTTLTMAPAARAAA